MTIKNFILPAVSALLLFSCVSSKKFKKSQADYAGLQTQYTTLQGSLTDCNNQKADLARQKSGLETDNAALNSKISDLNKQIDFLKENNTSALRQLQDLSVITSSQAESIKKSMENIGAKDNYIQTLQQQMAHKDSLNMALVMNLKGAVGNMDDKDINIKVDKGVVYIDISDNAPYHGGLLVDNWDLSVKRATSVVRILQNKYGLDPAKIAAAGRSEYKPVADNATKEGKAANRRTRIVILPQLDQFFKLLEPKQGT
jgi:chemotaxis protein MotB